MQTVQYHHTHFSKPAELEKNFTNLEGPHSTSAGRGLAEERLENFIASGLLNPHQQSHVQKKSVEFNNQVHEFGMPRQNANAFMRG